MLSYDDWLTIWTVSGRLEQRGKGIGKYVMARRGDQGPYADGNVEIIPWSQNIRDAYLNGRVMQRDINRQARARGWTLVRRGKSASFQVTCCGKYIGSYSSQMAAEAAYKNAVLTARKNFALKPSANVSKQS